MATPKDVESSMGFTHVEDSIHTAGDVTAVAVDEETSRYATTEIVIDAATNKRLFRMVNKRILSVMLVTYFCQSLDKGTLGFSSIMGIKTEAHLVGQDVSKQHQSCPDR